MRYFSNHELLPMIDTRYPLLFSFKNEVFNDAIESTLSILMIMDYVHFALEITLIDGWCIRIYIGELAERDQ